MSETKRTLIIVGIFLMYACAMLFVYLPNFEEPVYKEHPQEVIPGHHFTKE